MSLERPKKYEWFFPALNPALSWLFNMADAQNVLLNLAAFHPNAHVLGPGNRAAIWVQGCPFNCKGCIAPDWIPDKLATLVDPLILADTILKLPHLGGITISGGEPMTQAEPLFRLVERIRYINDLNVIIFSGYRYENLVDAPPGPFVHKLLENIDVLIDGLYIERLNNGKGLRGSTNQRFIHLTDRLKDYDFENIPRKVEVHLSDGEAFLVGVPDSKVLNAFQRGLDKARSRQIYGG